MLATVAARLARFGRVVRLGGDEFVVIGRRWVPATSVEYAVCAPIVTRFGVVAVGASVGHGHVTGSVEDALATADAAMFAAKRARVAVAG